MDLTKSSVAGLLATFMAASAFAQSASNESSLLVAAREEQAAVIASLEKMVLIESGSNDIEGLEEMARYSQDRLQALGAATERVPATNGQAPGLVKGVFKGNGKLRVMLIAHMDTVYRQGILDVEPYRREGNKLFGPGIADDKGGIAVVLHSLAILQKSGWNDYETLTVLFDPDEEIGSPGSGAIIAQLGSENDVVLSYEPSPAKSIAQDEGVLLSAAGTAQIKLVVTGRAAHAGAAHAEGRNALIELAHQLVQTRDLAETIPGAQLNWTTANGGTARNQIPGRAEAGSDVRFTRQGAAEELLAAIRSKVNENPLIPDTQSEVSMEIMRPMFVAGEKGLKLAQLAKSIYAELDSGTLEEETTREMPGPNAPGRNLLLIPETTGGTDAGFAASSGKPAVLESMGLAGWGYHAKNEFIEIDSIVPRLYLTSRMLVELGKRASAGDPL
ncbi:glutamate carboxypeptidase [Dokdonella sp.]|uniref:glutamate carboxypeptidase n=1 Tax=Dokdonella sp. TaxID=2291710 RepID=UPI003C4F8F1B